MTGGASDREEKTSRNMLVVGTVLYLMAMPFMVLSATNDYFRFPFAFFLCSGLIVLFSSIPSDNGE